MKVTRHCEIEIRSHITGLEKQNKVRTLVDTFTFIYQVTVSYQEMSMLFIKAVTQTLRLPPRLAPLE